MYAVGASRDASVHNRHWVKVHDMNHASPLTRRAAVTALAAALVVPPRRSWAQAGVPADFPRHPMTLIVPRAAGGPLDVLGRLLAQEYQARSGQTATVDNRTG